MKNQQSNRELVLGVASIVLGGLLFLLSWWLRSAFPNLSYSKLAEGIGIFTIGIGIWKLVQYINYTKNPTALRKARVESMDERKLWIRYHAGYNAFLFSVVVTYLALLIVGMAPSAIDLNNAWTALAGIVIGLMAVYIISLILLEKKY